MSNILEKTIRALTPGVYAKRAKARMQAARYDAMASVIGTIGNSGLSGFTGAKNGRAMQGWHVTHGQSADMDLINGMENQRDRVRDLERNNPIAHGIIETMDTNVIGTGLKMQSRIKRRFLGMSDEEAEVWQENVEREFQLWADDARHCDAASKLNFASAQMLAYISTLISGDVFVTLPFLERPGLPYNLKLNFIEADRVRNPMGKPETDKIAGGIEVDDYGSPLYYYITKTHPGGFSFGVKNSWETVRAFGEATGRRNVLHLYEMKRPGQRRGIPALAPVIETLKQLGRYSDAEIMAAVVSAFLTVFIKSENNEMDNAWEDYDDDGELLDSEAKEAAETSADLSLGSGALARLAPGEDIETVNPSRPNSNFGPFFDSFCQQIGASLGIGYELVVKQFRNSYSASRAALLEAGKKFKKSRKWTVDNFCQPVFEEWLAEAVANGRIDAPGFFESYAVRKAYSATEWHGDAMSLLDPLKETNAFSKQVKEGLITRSAAAAQLNGSNFETNVMQLAKENRLMEEAGFNINNGTSTAKAETDTDKEADKQDNEEEK